MNLIWKIDAWIMVRHQWVADRVYSWIGLSPYELAAQTFGVVILGNLAYWGIKFSSDMQSPSVFFMIAALCGVVVPSMWFWISITKHKNYQRTKIPPHGPWDDYFRVLIAMPLISTTLLALIYGVTEPLALFKEAVFLIEASAFYFFGCNAPTFIERKEHKLVESMG